MAASSAPAAAPAVCPRAGIAVPWSEAADTDSRCALLLRLMDRGLDLTDDTGRQILGEFARTHATVLELDGHALLPAPALGFLLQELPDAARMINFYNNTRYQVAWLNRDRSRFFATNNRSMQANFKRFQTRTSGGISDYLLFESGKTRLLLWQLTGKTVISIHLESQGQTTRYNIRIHIFTDSPGFHSFFESGLFRYLARTIVRGIIEDMTGAANKLAESKDTLPTLSPGFAEGLRSRVLHGIIDPEPAGQLLDGHRLGQIAGFVHIGPLDECNVVCQQLQGDGIDYR